MRRLYDQDELRTSCEPLERARLHLSERVTRRSGRRDERDVGRADGIWIASQKKAVSAANVIPPSVSRV